MFTKSALDELMIELPKPNYAKMKNEELLDVLFERGIEAPRDDEEKLIRKHAIALCMQWDERHPEKYLKDPQVRVIFSRTRNDNASPYVFLGLNGRGYQVPYETEVSLPLSVLRVADDAIEEHYETVTDPYTNRVTVEKRTERKVPYTVIGVANN